MTLEELKAFDGKDGRPAYTAYKGKVYDITDSKFWVDGTHIHKHFAGIDLTECMEEAPHGEEVFANFVPLAQLAAPAREAGAQSNPIGNSREGDQNSKDVLREWYRKWHPHPVTVHFPIALHYFAAFMAILFYFEPTEAYELSIFYSFAFSTVSGLVAMFPGIFSWWLNYDCIADTAFLFKLSLSIVTLLLGIIAICQRVIFPEVAWDTGLMGISYHAIIYLTVVTVSVNAFYGGKITWA